MDIEVEVRSFISEEQYQELIRFMNSNAEFIKKDSQITYYLSGEKDLRLQKNDFFSKIWLKSGKIHDYSRKEIEIKFEKEKFDELVKLFLELGYSIDIKWFRKRHEYKFEGVTVAVDHTKGYGYVIELEKMSDEKNKEKVYEFLKNKIAELGVKLTPKEEFENKFKNYKENWRTLTDEKL